MDNPISLRLKDIELFGFHGALPEEQKSGQKFLVDLTYWIEGKDFGDSLVKTVNYSRVLELVKATFNKKHYNLLESLARSLLDQLFNVFPQIIKAKVVIKKPEVKLAVPLKYASVCLKKSNPNKIR